MNVDRKNFKAVYNQIIQQGLINRTQAISIDLEFSGLRFENNEKERNEDMLYDRYQKMKLVVKKFNIIQVGLTFFAVEDGQIVAYPYNFYVFPRAYKSINPTISLQCSTVEFNSRNGMDWNRWIRDGVTYIPLDKVAQAFAVTQKATYEDLEVKLNEDQRGELTQLVQNLNQFIANEKKTEDTMEVSSTFIRLVVEKLLEKSYPNIYLEPFAIESSLKQKLLMCIKKVNTDDKEEIKKDLELSVLGFTAIFERLWRNPNICVVGHCSFFDLMYIYDSFVGELPSYFKFKSDILQGFPHYYDTKVLATRKEFQGIFDRTSLQDLEKVIKSSKFTTVWPLKKILLAKGFQKYDSANADNQIQLHQAGYDSYLTGWVFYQLQDKLTAGYEGRVAVVRSIWQINLSTFSDVYSEQTMVLVIVIPKPKQYTQNLLEVKKKKTYQIMETLNGMFSKGKYFKEDVRLREFKVDYIFVDLRNPYKRPDFVKDMLALKSKGLEIKTMGSYLKQKRDFLDKK